MKTLWVAFVILLAPVLISRGWAEESHLVGFELEDQFDRVYTDDDFRGRILIVVAGDRKGSEFNPLWLEAIPAALQGDTDPDQLEFVSMANLKGAPFFVRGMIKRSFPEDRNQWVILDWKGVFAKAYQFEEDKCNILVFGSDQLLAHQAVVTEVEEESLAAIVAVIYRLVGTP